MPGSGHRVNYTLFDQTVKINESGWKAFIKKMRRSDQLSGVIKDVTEQDLLKMLVVERHTKNRIFVIERLYIKYKKQRERREKVVLLTN